MTDLSPDLAERVARALTRNKFEVFVRPDRIEQAVEADWRLWSEDAEVALEASGHVELVKALAELLDNLRAAPFVLSVDEWRRLTEPGEAALAKHGGGK